METNTPETDDHESCRDAMSTRASSDYYSTLELCRKMERERDDARRVIFAIKAMLLDPTDSPAVVHERLVRHSLPASIKDLLYYEICAAWWPQFVSWGSLQDIIAGHFARKVEKKYRRWKWCVERSQRLSDLIPPNSSENVE